jgi:hypothetical protein
MPSKVKLALSGSATLPERGAGAAVAGVCGVAAAATAATNGTPLRPWISWRRDTIMDDDPHISLFYLRWQVTLLRGRS